MRQKKCPVKENELDKLYFLREGGNQHLDAGNGLQRQRRRMIVHLAKRKLREIEHGAICCLVNDDVSIGGSSRGVRGETGTRQGPENLKCVVELGPASNQRSGSTRDIKMQVLPYLACHKDSHDKVLNTLPKMITFTRASKLCPM